MKAVQLPRNTAVMLERLRGNIRRSPLASGGAAKTKCRPKHQAAKAGEFGCGPARHIERCLRSGTVRLPARLPDPHCGPLLMREQKYVSARQMSTWSGW